MNLLPMEPRVEKLSNFQWALLYKYLTHVENKNLKNYLTIGHRILGTDILGEDKLIPLTAFINIDMYKELLKKQEEGREVDDVFISEDMDIQAEDIFKTDIEAILTDEDREKMKKFEEKQLKEKEKIEHMLGVQVLKEGEEIASD